MPASVPLTEPETKLSEPIGRVKGSPGGITESDDLPATNTAEIAGSRPSSRGAIFEVYSRTGIIDNDFSVYTGAAFVVFSQDPTPGV